MVILAAIFSAVLFSVMPKTYAQNPGNESNGVLEIISLHLPDSVVFKPADGQVLKTILIYFVSGGRERGVEVEARNVSIGDDWIPFFTEHAVVRAMASPSVNTQKIKFVVDQKTVYYYDVLRDEWDPGSTPLDVRNENTRNRNRRNRR